MLCKRYVPVFLFAAFACTCALMAPGLLAQDDAAPGSDLPETPKEAIELTQAPMPEITAGGSSQPLATLKAKKANPATGKTYVVPIEGVITPALEYVIRRGIESAQAAGEGIVVFDMDTPGGSVEATEDIIRLLNTLPDEIVTYTLVNPDALSAGAYIAFATEHIYMTPSSRIGASAPIMGGGEDIPGEDLKEKVVSSIVSLMRSSATKHGHDPNLAEAMVRREYEYKIGDEMICPAGQLLTLSDEDASMLVGEGDQQRRLLSSGTVANLDALLTELGREETEKVLFEVTWSEKVARLVEIFRSLFLIGAALGIYTEIKTPGFGIPGFIGIICAIIFFWGHTVAGLAGWEEMILFTVGVVLIAIEVFVIPGFGVAGIAGIICMFTGLFLAMVQHLPGLPVWEIQTRSLESAATSLGVSIVGTAIAGYFLGRYLPETQFFRRISLTHEEDGGLAGATSQKEKEEDLAGLKGLALNQLRPSGTGVFGERRLSVVTHGDFFDEGTPIVIVEVKGNRIVVEKDRDAEANK